MTEFGCGLDERADRGSPPPPASFDVERARGHDTPVDSVEIHAQIVALLPRLRRFAFALTASKEDGDDLLQAAVERALSRIDQWRPGTRLDSWMFRIIQTVRIDQTRSSRSRRQHVSIEQEGYELADSGMQGRMEADLTLDAVLQAMSRLSDSHRMVLTLVCIEGMRYQEAAEFLDVSIGTVMSRLARARLRLHELIYGPAPSSGGNGDQP